MQNTANYSRYAIVLNIGLDNNPLDLLSDEQRDREIARLIATYMQQGGGFALVPNTVILSTVWDKGDGEEATLVLGFDLQARAFLRSEQAVYDELKARVHALADALSQDAIAFTFADIGENGTHKGQGLAGPRIELWGDFDPDKFRRLSTHPDAIKVPAMVG